MKIANKIQFILLGIVACSAFNSCSLDEDPRGFYTDKNFFKTLGDARSSLNYAYLAICHREYYDRMFFFNDMASEEMDYAPTTSTFSILDVDFWHYNTFATNTELEFILKYCYIGINRANAVIDNIESKDFEITEKNHILGQAYFLRAYHYFYLVRIFGLVPIHKHQISELTQAYKSRAKNLDEIYDFIIADLKHADELMRIEKVSGLADKVAAQSMLAKVYLQIASAKESGVALYVDMNVDVNDMYSASAEWAHKVLYEQTVYSFDPDLLNIYDVTKPDGTEHIFLSNHEKSGINDWNYSLIPKMFMVANSNQPVYISRPDGTYYKTCDGYGAMRVNDGFINSFETGDRRKDWLITKEVFKNSNGTGKITSSFGVTLKYIVNEWVGTGRSNSKPFLIRFSDIALVYAEAVGPTSEGYKWLNKIRNRANVADAPVNMSVTDFRNYVVRERSFELSFEANRGFDLRRKAIVTTTDPNAISSGITEKEAAFYPIPQKEIDLNPNL